MTVHPSEARWPAAFDVVVLGEVLVEVSTDQPLHDDVPARIGISGDALNSAAAAAGTGARVGLYAVLSDDELGRAIAERVCALGISPDLLTFRAGQQGMYLTHIDPTGQREFFYARQGSVGSTLAPRDLDERVLAQAGAVITSGITCAISASALEVARFAARTAGRFVYDPNFRPRLVSAVEAGRTLMELAPHSYLLTPSHPGETGALLGCGTAADAAAMLRSAGAANVAVTCGADGVHLDGPDGVEWVDAVPAPDVVDQTGAGDAFAGVTAARIAAGSSMSEAAAYGAAAASIVVGGRGGTGAVPTLEGIRARRETRREGRQSTDGVFHA